MTQNEKIGQKFENNGIQDGGAAILKFTKSWITSEPLDWFSPNLVRSFALMPYRQCWSQNGYFSKSKMAADEKLKFTKNWITSKRFVLYTPNLARIIRFAPGTSLWSQNVEICNPTWPPAAILKFAKTWITPELLVLFSPNLAQSFNLIPTRDRMSQNRHFSKSKMAADEKLKFTAPNLVCIIRFAPWTSLWSQNVEIYNSTWPPAAILKFAKTWLTPEPLVRFSPNLAQSFILTPPRDLMS